MTWNTARSYLNKSTIAALAILVAGLTAGINSLAGTLTGVEYRYDSLGQLVSAVYRDYSTFTNSSSLTRRVSRSYVYDAMGNRLIMDTDLSGASSPGRDDNARHS